MIRAIALKSWNWLNRRFNLVSDDPYYSWADEWLDNGT